MGIQAASGVSAGLVAAASSSPPGEQAAAAVLKKALDIQAQGASALIAALPAPINPPSLGSRFDASA